MKTLEYKFILITAIALLLVTLAPGCKSLDNWTARTGTPSATNYVPQVTVHAVTNYITVTNTIPALVDPTTGQVLTEARVDVATAPVVTTRTVTNVVPVISYEMSESTKQGIKAIGGTGAAFGVPLLQPIAGTIGTILASLYAFANRRRLGQSQTANVVLVQNVEAMKKLALEYATALGKNDPAFVEKVNSWSNDTLQGLQAAAGVEALVRSLVAKHTGDTRQDVGSVPQPKI